ncbi:hypothetical protein K3495_g4183 [Podosphaera aphanis]|nr:hypothetical protein K3495_g4183 [Podosphaera aphanis]
MRKLSQHQVSSITTLLDEGEKELEKAKIMGCQRSTVARYRKKTSHDTSKPVQGRPRKLTCRGKRALAHLVANSGTKPAVETTKIINPEREDKVSPGTVELTLRKQGLRAIKRVKKPMLSKAHKRARLHWALEPESWTIEDWKRVIWSDETKINRLNSDGIKYAWSRNPSSYPAEVVEETLKFGGACVMMWGCMSWFGAGGMSRGVGRMNSEQLIGILNTCLVLTVDEIASKLFSNARNNVVFQQDNDAKHTSRATKNWLATTGINTMKRPSKWPDLNPNEHLWCLVKRRLGESPETPKNMHKLMERVDDVWQNIHEDSCRTLIESMPSRVLAVKKEKGGHTKY